MFDEKLLEEHRKMVLISGNLSDFQINNLKNWATVAFGDFLKSASVTYDFSGVNVTKELGSGMSAGVVVYNLSFIPIDQRRSITKEELKARADLLTAWVKVLFWNNTSVEIKRNGKKWAI